MIELKALVDMPWKSLKKGDTYEVPSLLGVARSEIALKQAAVVGAPTAAPAAEPEPAPEAAPEAVEATEAAEEPTTPRKRRRRRQS